MNAEVPTALNQIQNDPIMVLSPVNRLGYGRFYMNK